MGKDLEAMKKNTRNFIAKLLVLCMIVALLPTVLLAAGAATTGDPYSTGSDVTPEAPVKQEVQATAKTENGTAKAEVTSSDMNKAVEEVITKAAAENKAPQVEITVETSADATSLQVALPTDSLKTLAEKNDASLSIASDVANVQLDNTALNALVDGKTGNVTLDVKPSEDTLTGQKAATMAEVKADANAKVEVYDLELTVGDTPVTDFNGGKLTIALPYTVPAGSSANDVRAYCLKDDGKFELRRGAKFVDGKVEFTTTHLSTYVVTTTPLVKEFSDVADGQWYTDAVDWAAANNITTGQTDTVFGLTGPCNRGQIVTFLYRAAGSPTVTGVTNPFTDVTDTNAFYYNAVLWAVDKGITTGKTDTTFEPDTVCNRGEIVTFLWRYCGKQITGSNSFVDLEADGFYVDAVNWAVANKVTSGMTTTTFEPNTTCNRSQAVMFLYNMSKLA